MRVPMSVPPMSVPFSLPRVLPLPVIREKAGVRVLRESGQRSVREEPSPQPSPTSTWEREKQTPQREVTPPSNGMEREFAYLVTLAGDVRILLGFFLQPYGRYAIMPDDGFSEGTTHGKR